MIGVLARESAESRLLAFTENVRDAIALAVAEVLALGVFELQERAR